MKKMRNRIVSGLLALTMVASLLPAGILTPSARADQGYTISDVKVYTDGSYEFKLHSSGEKATTDWGSTYVAGVLDVSAYSGGAVPSTGTVTYGNSSSSTALSGVLTGSAFGLVEDLFKICQGVTPGPGTGSAYDWTYTVKGSAGDLISDSALRDAFENSITKSFYNGTTQITKDTPTYKVCLIFRSGSTETFQRFSVDMTVKADGALENGSILDIAGWTADPTTFTSTNGGSDLDCVTDNVVFKGVSVALVDDTGAAYPATVTFTGNNESGSLATITPDDGNPGSHTFVAGEKYIISLTGANAMNTTGAMSASGNIFVTYETASGDTRVHTIPVSIGSSGVFSVSNRTYTITQGATSGSWVELDGHKIKSLPDDFGSGSFPSGSYPGWFGGSGASVEDSGITIGGTLGHYMKLSAPQNSKEIANDLNSDGYSYKAEDPDGTKFVEEYQFVVEPINVPAISALPAATYTTTIAYPYYYKSSDGSYGQIGDDGGEAYFDPWALKYAYIPITIIVKEGTVTPSTSDVTFDPDGGKFNGDGSFTGTSSVTVTTDTAGKLSSWPKDPTKDGYTFTGWANGGTTYTGSETFSLDITLTAQYKANTASVKLQKNGTALGDNIQVQLYEGPTLVATANTNSSGIASFGSGGTTVLKAGTTYKIYVPENTGSTTLKDSGKTLTIAATGNNAGTGSATVDYYTLKVNADGTTATAVAAPGGETIDGSVGYLPDAKVKVTATPATIYNGTAATWTKVSGGTNASHAPDSTDANNTATITVGNAATEYTVSYETKATYDATVTVKVDGTASAISVSDMALVDSTAAAANKTMSSGTSTGVYTASGINADVSYDQVKLTVDGITYTFKLSDDITNSNKLADANLYTVNLSVTTTDGGSKKDYGTAVATVNSVSKTAATDAPIPFRAPAGEKLAMSKTPETNYTFKKWVLAGTVNTTDTPEYTVQSSSDANGNLLVAHFIPHAVLDVTPASAPISLTAGSSTFKEVVAVGDGTNGKGYVKNTGVITTGDLKVSIVDGSTFSSANDSTIKSNLQVTLDLAALAADAGKGLKIEANAAGLAANTTHTAYVWIYAEDGSGEVDGSNNALLVYDCVEITIKATEGNPLTITEGPVAWDTYTETASDDTLKLTIDDDGFDATTPVSKVLIGSTELTATIHYTVAAVSGDDDSRTLTFTPAGLQKMAEVTIANGATNAPTSNVITVQAKNGDKVEKTSTATFTLTNSMPELTKAEFDKTTWKKGSDLPVLKVTDSNGKDGTTGKLHTGEIKYQWYKNGTAIPGETGPALSSTSGLNPGDEVMVRVYGTGKDWDPAKTDNKYWDPKSAASGSYTDLYRASVVKEAKFTVQAPTVTVDIWVDGSSVVTPTASSVTYTDTASETITASATYVSGGAFSAATTTTGSYRFNGWGVNDTSGTPNGAFADDTLATTTFTPTKDATITAKWLALGVLDYKTNGSTATASGTGAYTEALNNSGPGTALITNIEIDDTTNFTLGGALVTALASGSQSVNASDDSANFTITPNSTTPAKTYVIKVTTTYEDLASGGEEHTVIQYVTYTVERNVTVTLVHDSHGTLTGKHGSTTVTTTTSADKTLTVPENSYVTLSTTANSGYKFNGWTATKDANGATSGGLNSKLLPSAANANVYGPAEENVKISAAFKPVTDLSETHTRVSDTQDEGYTSGTVYSGTMTNSGAAAATVTYTLGNFKKDGTATSGTGITGKFSVSPDTASTDDTIAAASKPGVTNGTSSVTVTAAAGLPIGTYTMTLTIQETTNAADTKNGQFRKTIDLTFTVGRAAPASTFPGTVTVLLDTAVERDATVKLRPDNVTENTSHTGYITMTKPVKPALPSNPGTTTYTLTDELDVARTYTIYVSGKSTGLALSTVNHDQTIQLWSLAAAPDNATKGLVTTSPNFFAVTGGSGYLDGSYASASATAKPGYAFDTWVDNFASDNDNKTGLTGDALKSPGISILMNSPKSVTANFIQVVGVKYHDSYTTSGATEADVVYTDNAGPKDGKVKLYGALTRPGYAFDGWSLTSGATSGGMAAGSEQAVASWTVTDGFYHLYAVWTPVTPTWPTLPEGEYGKEYSGMAIVNNAGEFGANSYSYTGTLPGGLTFTNGVISGKPYVTGTFTITVTPKDAKGNAIKDTSGNAITHAFTLKVNATKPEVKNVTFTDVTDGMTRTAAKITADVVAPLYLGKDGTTDKWEDHTYTFTKYVNTPETNPASPDVGQLEVTSPTGTTISFTNNTVDATVTFTPSTDVKPGSHNQVFNQIYTTAEGTGTMALDGKSYNIAINPNPWTAPTPNTWKINVGESLPSAAEVFAVINKGNQDAYVIYELEGADAGKFTLDPTYTESDATKTDKIAKPNAGNTENPLNPAFTIIPNSGIDTSKPGKYTVTVVAKNYGKANPNTASDKVYSTDRVTLTFEVAANDYTGEVTVNLNAVASADTKLKDKSPKDSVIFVELDGSGNPTSTTIGGVFGGTAGTSGKYTASLLGNKTYGIKVDGVLIDGLTVSATDKTAEVNFYEVKTAYTGCGSGTPAQSAPGFLLPGQTGTITTSSAVMSGTTTYTFKTWDNSAGTTSSATVTMSSTSPAAITYTATYEEVLSNEITITYMRHHDDSDNTTLWTQKVNKDTDLTIYATVPTRPGYTFSKWNTKKDGSGTDYTANQAVTGGFSTSQTLYAIWAPATINWSTLPDGTYGETYTGSAIVTNGNATGPLKYTAAAATTPAGGDGSTAAKPYLGLPDGLSLAENGALTGTPRETGYFKFVVTGTGTDASNTGYTCTNTYTIFIDKAQPTLSGVSFGGVAEGATVNTEVKPYGTVTAPLCTGVAATPSWDDSKDYEYTASATPNAGTLTITKPTGTLTFGGSTTATGKVKFTPGNAANGYAGTHQTTQTYAQIYKDVEDPCVFSLGGQLWDVKVEPPKKDFGSFAFGTASTDSSVTAQDFTVTNLGNQDVYLQYALTDSTYFDLTINTYNNTPSGGTAPTSDKLGIASGDKSISAAFTVKPKFTATTAPYTYTTNVEVTVCKDEGCTDEVKTILVPVTFKITSTDYDATVRIDLTPETGTKQTNKKVPDSGVVTFVATDNSVTIAGAWSGTEGNSDGLYTATLSGGKEFKVYVNGKDTGKTVKANTATETTNNQAIVDMYELVLDQDGTSKDVQNITGAQAGNGYYLPGEKVNISTPPSCGKNSTNYDFANWTASVNTGTIGDASDADAAKKNPNTYTMPSGANAAAVKLTANYGVRTSDKVLVTYYQNPGLVLSGATDVKLAEETHTKGGDYTIADLVPGLSGYIFTGWNTDPDGTSGTSYTAGNTVTGLNTALTLYACWSNGLNLEPLKVEGTYLQATPISVYHGATGGSGTYTSYVGASEAFDGTNKIFDLTLTTETSGANKGKSLVSGRPNDTGTKTSNVTVTDSDGKTASAVYTIVIGKAEVEVSGSGDPMPTTGSEVTVADPADLADAIKTALDGVQMDGVGTGETDINGTWSIDDALPTTDGTATIHVTFHPANDSTATSPRDKDGDHYNPKTFEIPVIVGGKLIKNAYLDTGATIKPVGGATPVNAGGLAGKTNSLQSDPAGADYTNDVEILQVSWSPAMDTNGKFRDSTAYTITVVLGIRDDSLYRFDTNGFTASTIAGQPATKVQVEPKVAILSYTFPAAVTKIDFTTAKTLVAGTSESEVTIPGIKQDEYEFVTDDAAIGSDGYKWVPYGGAIGDSLPAGGFVDGEFYDLIVVVKPMEGVDFDYTTFNKAVGAELKTGNAWDATVNEGAPLEKDKNATVEVAPTVADGKITKLTIRYKAFKAVAKSPLGIQVVKAELGVNYAQTGKNTNHNLDATATSPDVPDVGNKPGVTFVPDLTTDLVVKYLYKVDGTDALETNGSPLSGYTVHLAKFNSDGTISAGDQVPASFKDGYGGNADVSKFDGKPLVAVLGGFVALIPDTFTVKQLTAGSIAPNPATGGTRPSLVYSLNDKFKFDSSAANALKATVVFNPDVTGLRNEVTDVTYAQYAATASETKTYFLEYGDATAKTFVAHTDVDTLDANARLTELVPGSSGTSMTAAMNGKTLYMTFIDVNHNLVRTPLGILRVTDGLSVDIIDENGQDPEYGDKLTADPAGGTPKDDGTYDYVWKKWVPNTSKPVNPDAPADVTDKRGTWEPITDGNGDPITTPEYTPGKDDVGDHIRVEVTDGEGNTATSDRLIQPRSLNFIVNVQNKTYNGTPDNTHTYVTGDFTIADKVTHVYKNNAFERAPVAFGGLMSGDTVTVTPAATAANTDWNDADASRPPYETKDVGKTITWPAVLTGGDATTNDKLGGYVLGGHIYDKDPDNEGGEVEVYRLVPQPQQTDRGTILGGSGVTHVDVHFNERPVEYHDVLTHPTKVTEPDETRPGDSTTTGKDTTQDYGGSTKWYYRNDGTTTDPFAGFNPTAVDTKFSAIDTSKYQPNLPYGVVVAVKPQPDKEYNVDPAHPEAKDRTRFYFHFGLNQSVEVTTSGVVTAYDTDGITPKTYDPKLGGLVIDGDVYYMWYSFDKADEGEVEPPTISDLPANHDGSGTYYAKTETSAGSNDHHYLVNNATNNSNPSATAGADHDPTPGGKAEITFTYGLKAVVDLIAAADTAGSDTDGVKLTFGGVTTVINAANYGTVWRLVAGADAASAKDQFLDTLGNTWGTVASLASVGKVFKDDLTNSANNDSAKFDGAKIYIQHVTGGVASGTELGTLEVKQLTAESITPTGTLNLTYNDNATFDTSGITAAAIAFNAGTGVATTYDRTRATDEAADGQPDAARTKYYFEYVDADGNRKPLPHGTTLTRDDYHNRPVYICYTDVNDHEVEARLGELKIGSVVSELTISYTTPANGENPKDEKNYTDTARVTVAHHVKNNAATNQWYKLEDTMAAKFGANDFALPSNAMKFVADVTDPDKPDAYAYNTYYVVKTTFAPIGTNVLTTGTKIRVDDLIDISANNTASDPISGKSEGVLRAQAKLESNGTITLLTLYKVGAKPDTTEDADDVFVTYAAPVTGATPDDDPATYGNTDRVSIAENTTEWYKLGTTLGNDRWTNTTTKQTNAYEANNWYRAEAIITPKAGYTFKTGQMVKINGIDVTVNGAIGTITDATGNPVGYVKAEWGKKTVTIDGTATEVDDTTKIKAMYIAQTQDKTPVTLVTINYTTPADAVAAAEYVSYMDPDMVTVYKYAAAPNHAPTDGSDPVDPDGTKWYPVSGAADFSTTGTVMTIGTTAYEAGKYYLVQNVIHPDDGYQLTATTKVVVDDKLVVTAGGTVATTGKTNGLVSAKATCTDGVITIQSIYRVPAVSKIVITYPEPVATKKPTSIRTGKTTLWTYNMLLDEGEVSVAENALATGDPRTDGTTWYKTTLSSAPGNAAAIKAEAVSGNKMAATDAFILNTYYLVEGKITSDGLPFDTTGVKVTINGIEVTVGTTTTPAVMGTGANGWAMAEFAVDDNGTSGTTADDVTYIAARYVAKTLDANKVTAVAINYTTPVADVAAAEYVSYVDSKMVTVNKYADNNTDGTKWYPVSGAADFSTTGTVMTIGTTAYEAGKYYLVQNVIHPNDEYQLGTWTKVMVDGNLEVSPTTAGAVTNATDGRTSGLMSVQATLNSDGTVTVQSIYFVPALKDASDVYVYYTAPEADVLPNTKPAYGRTEQVNIAADATKWYSLGNALPTDGTQWTNTATQQTAAYVAGTWYRAESIVTAETGYTFATDGSQKVTINNIEVTVDGAVGTITAPSGTPVGYVKAVWADAEKTKIKTMYIAKTADVESYDIYHVKANVTVDGDLPAEGDRIRTTAERKQAWLDNASHEDATNHVNLSTLSWVKSTDPNFTTTSAASGSFERGYYYKVTFTAEAASPYHFKNVAGDYVAFQINNVNKDESLEHWGINNKQTPDDGEENGVKVHTEKAGSDDKYTITVTFPLLGGKDDLAVHGEVVEPVANAPINASAITLKPEVVDPEAAYTAKNGADNEATKWQHWNKTTQQWEDTLTGDTFRRGEYYRALITAQMSDNALIRNRYNDFKPTTEGYVKVGTVEVKADDVQKADLNAAPGASLKTSKVYEINNDTTVTLVKEFKVPKLDIEVKIHSNEPKFTENGTYNIDMDVNYFDVHTGYTLSDGEGVVGQWYDEGRVNKLAGENGDKGTPFAEGTYYLITTATAEDGYYFKDDLNGYHWVEHDQDKIYEPLDRDEDGNIVSVRIYFKYTIRKETTVVSKVPGNAHAPVYGQPLDKDGWTDANFTVVPKEDGTEVTWYDGAVDKNTASDDKITKDTTADKDTYTAAITVKPNDGVQLGDTLTYWFNGVEITANPNEYTKNDNGTYTLYHTFTTTGNKGGGGGGGGGGGTVESPVVYYHLKDKGTTEDPTAEKVKRNGSPKQVPKVKALTGLKFLGWSEVDPSTLPAGKLPTLVDPTTFKITADKWFYAVYEEGTEVDHLHYVIGFPNGTFGPDAKITRAEVATIIARSCLEGFVEGANYGNPGNYNDVSHHWAFSAIAFCAREGVFNGYEDGTFRPDRYITRQELATVVARLAGIQTSQGVPFSDKDLIASWAMNGIYTAYANGWINGYEDGTFQPEREISRAETVKIFNGYLKRGVNAKGLEGLKEYIHTGVASNNTQDNHDEYMTWPDVPKTHWAYHEIIEAANDHNYHWQDAEKATPPEDWDEVYIDKKWKYNDNLDDGAEKRDENISAQKEFTVTYLVVKDGVVYDSMTETVERFASPKPENQPQAVPDEGYRFAGWSSTDPSTGTVTLVDPTASSVTSDKWYYAVFEEATPYALPVYTVTYVIGANGSYDGATVERVEMFQAPSLDVYPHPVAKAGYRFLGWSETDPATGSYEIMDPTANYVTSDKTFYAVYEAI